MKRETIFSRLSTAQLFVALAGGVALYLIPRDVQGIHSPLQELYAAAMAGVICVLILIFFKSYETIGISLLIGMSFLIVSFLENTLFRWMTTAGGDRKLVFQLDYHLGILWALIWMVPFLICLLVRIFALNEWDTSPKRLDFSYFSRWSGIALGVFYGILLLFCFVLNRPIDMWGTREVNLIPFHQIVQYFSSSSDIVYFLFGNLFFFTPIGFFLAVSGPSLAWWKKLLIAFGIGTVIESIQWILNTGMVDIDDVLLNAAGFYIGCGLKWAVDKVRWVISGGTEDKIFYFPSHLPDSHKEKASFSE